MLADNQIPTLQETAVTPAPEAGAVALDGIAPESPATAETPAPDTTPLTAIEVTPPQEAPPPAIAQDILPVGTPEAPAENPPAPALETRVEPTEEAPAFPMPESTPEPEAGQDAMEPSGSIPTSLPEDSDPLDEKAGFWDSVLTGSPATVPDAVRKQAGCYDPSLDAEEQDYLLAQTINRSWMVDNKGLSRETVRSEWPVLRAQMARELGVANDERDVFCALSIMRRDSARREASRSIAGKAYMDGLLGKDYQDDKETLDTLDAADRAAADALGVRTYQEGAELRAQWLPLAEKTARALDMFAAMEEEFAPSKRLFTDAPEFLTVLDDLCELDDEKLNLVLYLATDLARGMRRSGAEDEGLFPRLYRAVRRGGTNFGLNLAQAASNLANAATLNVGQLIGGDTGKSIEGLSDEWDKRSRMAYRLRQISQQGISPLTPPSKAHEWDSYLVDATESIPAGMLAFCGFPGFALITSEALGGSLAEARARAPQGSLHNQLGAGVVAGTLQAGIYLSLNRVGGKMLENSISSFMKSRGAGAAAFSMNALRTSGAAAMHGTQLWAAGKASQATELGVYETFSRLEGTASNINWKQFGENFMDIETNMHEAAMLLPFVLIGSGRASIRHFRAPGSLVRDPQFLREEWGMDEPTIRKIMEAPDLDTKGELLRQALTESARWNKPEFIQEATRSLALLNTEHFTEFSDPEVVRDFLRLPAQGALPALPEPRPLSKEEMKSVPEYGSDTLFPDLYPNSKSAESLNVWYTWLQKSHLAERVGPYFRALIDPETHDTPRTERAAAYQLIIGDKTGLVSNDILNDGIYSPLKEMQRNALLRDTVKEATDLSYQFILWAYTPHALRNTAFPVQRQANDAEKARMQVLGQVGRTVLSMALGTRPDIAIRTLQQHLGNYLYRRRYRGGATTWLKDIAPVILEDIPDIVADYDHFQLADKPELREVLRVVGGLSACAQRLVNLLPMSADFTTALSRGVTPAQAFHHLTQRELGYNPEKVVNYPLAEIQKTVSTSNMELFGKEAGRCYNLLRTLTGIRTEKAAGEGGVRHWRVLKPDGSFTRWHDSERAAVNDLAISVAPYFAPLGDKFYRWMRFFNPRKKFDIADRPTASYKEFCGFDQLAGIAAEELKDRLFRSATRTMPGFIFQRLRKRVGGHSTLDPMRVQTQRDDSRDPGGDVVVDSLSTLTPYTLINARMRVFWKRMLDSRFIPAGEVEDFLQAQNLLTPERRVRLEEMIRPLPHPKNPDVPLNQTPPPDISGRNRFLAETMADFHTTHYFAHLEDHNLPDSVFRWFSMVPFCPPLPPEQSVSPVSRYVSLRIPFGPGGRTALAWSNRMTAMKINGMAKEFADMRTRVRKSPLPENIAEMFRLAEGESPAQRYEQGWCFHSGGYGVFRSTPQYMWNLLQFPRRGWSVMTEPEKADLRRRIGYLVESDPSQWALDATGRGENTDYVEQAVLHLDEVLQRHPELHSYAPVPDSTTAVRVISLNDDLPLNTRPAPVHKEPISLNFDDDVTGDDISSKEIPLPEFFQQEPDALQALRFLHLLRGTTTQRPYVVDNRIWWNNTPYGGRHGKAPEGLSGWEEEIPLYNIFLMLNNIQRQSQGNATKICGIPIRGADWSPQDFRDLDAVSVYRWPLNRSRVYRLMPGFPDSSSEDVRTPYMVQSHSGVYLAHDNTSIHDPAELYSSYTPLEFYNGKGFTVGDSDMRAEWRKATIGHTLDALSAWPEHAEEMVGDPYSGVHGLSELLLRLCEDTGFSHVLKSDTPSMLSVEEVHILNLARGILDCMQNPGSAEAMEGFRQALRPLQDPDQREAIIDTLLSCNDEAGKRNAVESAFRTGFRQTIRRALRTAPEDSEGAVSEEPVSEEEE